MSYVEENLLPGEQVRFTAHLHWIIYVKHVLLMFVVVGFFTIWAAVMRQKGTEMVVTNFRVIMKTGWVSRRSLEMQLKGIETISVDQTTWGRMLGYGSVKVVGTGGTTESFSHVANPLGFRNAVNHAVHDKPPVA